MDDDEGVRNFVSGILDAAGYQVFNAAAGQEALEFSRTHEGDIHLLVTDFDMPGMNGLEVATALLKSRPELKTLFITGAEENLREEELRFLLKPFEPEDLLRQVKNLLLK